MSCFPCQCLTTLGRQLLLSKGTSASLSLVTRATLVEGTHSQYPPHQEFWVLLGCWVTGCITHIHSWQFADEVGKGGPNPTSCQGETGDRAPGATKRKGCRSEILPGKPTMGCVLCRADSLTVGVASVFEELGQLWKMPKG